MGAAAIPLVIMGSQIAGSIIQGVGAQRAGATEKQILDFNADRARERAVDARGRGALLSSRKRMEGSQVIGSARAAAGASGVDVQSGSVTATIEQTRAMSELDAETIKNNALREALGYEAEADSFNMQGRLAKARGNYGLAASIFGGASSAGSTGHNAGIFSRTTSATSTGYDAGSFPKFGKG